MPRLATALCFLALLTSSRVLHAEINWSYIGDKQVQIGSGGSTVNFTGTVGSASNSTGLVLFNLTASSTTSNDGPPDHFNKTPFTLTVSVVDEKARVTKTGNELGTLTFKGAFTADITKGSLTGWSVDWNASEAFAVLGNKTVGFRKYDLMVDGFLPPSPNNPLISGQGAIHASALVTTVDGGSVGTTGGNDPPPTPSETPEPGSLLLAGLGLSGLAVAWRRRTRQPR
ncbi:MAG: PEP-CTERM sorting domain-containing protein [Gemmataceae bacterium]